MKIAIFGASGLIGSKLQRAWRSKYDVLCATHTPGDDLFWDVSKGWLDGDDLEDVDLIINLAGENIASGRWTRRKKRRIVESRVKTANMIAKAIQGLKKPPKMWIQASAVGFYGSREDEKLDEMSSSGEGFLADVCKQWELAAMQVGDATRLVRARFGMVLSEHGGALQKMLPPFQKGLGGKIGSGKQWMSWITLDEIPDILEHIYFKGLSGAVNVVSSEPVRNSELTKVLGEILHRPTKFTMPAFMAKLIFGQMGDELLLASTRVEPKVLIDSGYTFKESSLHSALKRMLS